MAKAEFRCPACGSTIRVNATGLGMSINCLECLTSIQVPRDARIVEGADTPPPLEQKVAFEKSRSFEPQRETPYFQSTPQPKQDDSYKDGIGLIVPYRNGYALAAYYCGVFGLMPCIGIPIALAGFILGWMGLHFRHQNPESRGAAHAWAGIILGGLSLLGHAALIVVLALTS
ncbi:DUF4190 domain-containing protein [Candidatus Sumerlaeota bacterium]|nr:DUF4190 domain-containing protein [Candidatus Sumerlaeota bacterium]